MSDVDRSEEGRRPSSDFDGVPARDPLQDTMPWTFDNDPVAEQLRAWRKELGPDPYSTTGSAPTIVPSLVQQATTEPAAQPNRQPSGAPNGSERPRRAAHQHVAEAPGASTAPWPFQRLRRRSDQPLIDEPLRQVESALSAPTRRGRHAGWDVTSVQVESSDPAAAANARARTVAFPALDLVPTRDDDTEVEYAIEVEGLRKAFKDTVAVGGVTFKVPKGKIIALLGPNGAGKTTVVNMLCTLLRPDSGSASVNGYDVVDDAASVRASIMLTGQFAALDESLTGRENLVLFGRLLGLTKVAAKARAAELLETFSLVASADKQVGQYSGGMRRRIDIACGLVTEPKVVFLDEPTTGLDPRSRQEVWTLVEQLREDGVTVLLTTQYLEEADVLSDRIIVIDHGVVIAEGTSDELKAATGAAYCEITPAHPAYLPRLRGKLTDMLGPGGGDVDSDTGAIAVPAPNGPDTLAEVIRRTEAAHIPLADIALRRPSLDEVFLALTGSPASDEEHSADDDD
ncbi:MAG: ATP-binding cassette domain-containing protein [Gordonia sp. (in: high G+C Gram-positive bacteria)]|uniref:ATP-binding cassette domain-containing protein n=1 Tax=Gordonia sp. (in: high G+C Gram-positive bacteria) TaxID=84139 RepID=UPI003C75725C